MSNNDQQEVPTYEFQCQRCFIMSGMMSCNVDDAPLCCGGEPMMAVRLNAPIRQSNVCTVCGGSGVKSANEKYTIYCLACDGWGKRKD